MARNPGDRNLIIWDFVDKRKAASKSQVTFVSFQKAAWTACAWQPSPSHPSTGFWPFFTEAKADARGEMLMALVREELKLAKTRFALKEVFRPFEKRGNFPRRSQLFRCRKG